VPNIVMAASGRRVGELEYDLCVCCGRVEQSRNRLWTVVLLGGPSGVGKTSVSYRVARHYDVGLTEVDDLHALKQLTTPEQQPFARMGQEPAGDRLARGEILELHISVCRVMAPAVAAVVANHVETRTPIVLEGDYLLPEMVTGPRRYGGRGIPHEPYETQIVRNFVGREPEGGDPAKRARVNWLFGQWLPKSAADTT
jgi:hypothetical protein